MNGMLKIFSRSRAFYDAKYVKYIRDGDAEIYPELQNSFRTCLWTEYTYYKMFWRYSKKNESQTATTEKFYAWRKRKIFDGKPLSGKRQSIDTFIDQVTLCLEMQ